MSAADPTDRIGHRGCKFLVTCAGGVSGCPNDHLYTSTYSLQPLLSLTCIRPRKPKPYLPTYAVERPSAPRHELATQLRCGAGAGRPW